MTLWFHPEALDELVEAAAWYDAREPGLGQGLIDEVHDGLRWIEDQPMAWPLLPASSRYRAFRLRRFPYLLPYGIEQEKICVWAVAHSKRHGDYWKSRV